jgi:pyruvate, water dikinase
MLGGNDGQRTQDAFIISFAESAPQDYGRIGGKCASLARMIACGVAVPAGFAVTTDAYSGMLENPALKAEIASLLDGTRHGDVTDEANKAARIRQAILAAQMPSDVEVAIRRAYRQMAPDDEMPVAVRSSATAEDLPDASFAGLQDTFLWVVGADAVVEKVKACWASLFNARAISYRARNRFDQLDVQMAVGVQKMVNASAAGVALTLDPITGDRTKIVIDASFGLGEPVVSGEITPDNFVVEKILLEVSKRRIADKGHELVADHARRCTVERVIEAERRMLPSLTDDQVLAVARLAKSLERMMGCPQDVEWAIDRDLPEGSNLVALQSRPETVWSRKPPATRSQRSLASGIEGVLGTLMAPLQIKQ